MEIASIWIGYGIAVAGVAFGTKNPKATKVVAFFGACAAVFSTYCIAAFRA